MKHIFLVELRRALNGWFMAAVVGTAFAICFDSWNDLIQSLETGVGEVHYFFWNSAYGGMCRNYLIPVFAAFPFAASFCRERKNRSLIYIAAREGRRGYCIIKYIVTVLSGGVVIALGTALTLALLSMSFPMVDMAEYQETAFSDVFHEWSAVYHPAAYCMIQTGLGLFRGMIWSGMALFVSIFTEDPFVVIASPYVGNYAVGHFSRLLHLNNEYRIDMILIGRSVIHSSLCTMIIAFIVTMILLFVIGVLFTNKVDRRLRDGTIT